MNAQSPSAYAASIGLHALIVALILVSVYLVKRNADDGPKIFTLVGGEGMNYAATQAPAAGEPGATGIEQVALPPIPTPVRQPEPEPLTPVQSTPPAPDPAPLQAVQQAAKAAAAPPVETKPVDFTKNIVRLSEKRKANIEKKFKADQAREARLRAEREKKEAAARRKAEEAKRVQMTKAEFDKANKGAKTPASKSTAASTKVPSVADGVRKGMAGAPPSSTREGAGGTAQQRADADLMSAYISMIVARIRQTMTEANFSDELSVELQFSLSSGGVITGTKLLGGSGSSDFDRAVLDAFRSIPNLGPPPNGKGGTFRFNLIMKEDG